MTFYNDKWIIANIDEEEILLLRKSTNDILLDRIRKDSNTTSDEYIINNVLEEYDASIGNGNQLYIIYQNKEKNLIITILDGEKREDIKLTAEPIPEVIDLNIIVDDNRIHIVYLIKNQDEENKYRIYHNYYDGMNWETFIVEDILAKKVINPIKLIRNENNIIIGYYVNDLEIELKEFNIDELKWGVGLNLVNNPNEKLYLDMIKHRDNIHLTYCEFQEGNLVVKYEQFNLSDKGYEKKLSDMVSNEGSSSHPTIIIYGEDIWVVWIELDKVISRVSTQYGTSWSDSIYTWDNTKSIDFVRYKYLTIKSKEDRTLDYSFGSIYPEIEFIGFGSLEKAKEISIKKKSIISFPRI